MKIEMDHVSQKKLVNYLARLFIFVSWNVQTWNVNVVQISNFPCPYSFVIQYHEF